MFATRPFGGGTVELAHFLQSTIGNQATLRLLAQRDRSPTGNERIGQHEQKVANAIPKAPVSWNFANIPIFSPHQVEHFHSKSSLPAFPLQSAIKNEQEADIPRDMRGAASDDTTLMDQLGGISAAPDNEKHSPSVKYDRNAWRQGKALLQVAIPGDAHIELSILAKRRRMPLSQLVKSALNLWLETHSHTLQIIH